MGRRRIVRTIEAINAAAARILRKQKILSQIHRTLLLTTLTTYMKNSCFLTRFFAAEEKFNKTIEYIRTVMLKSPKLLKKFKKVIISVGLVGRILRWGYKSLFLQERN